MSEPTRARTTGARAALAALLPQDWRLAGLLILVLALPPLLGDVGTIFILALALLVLWHLARTNRAALHVTNRAEWLFIAAFALMALAFVVSARTPADIRFAFNFAPLLLALPVVWIGQARPWRGGLVTLATLALLGTALAALVAILQVFVLGDPRAGGHVINEIHFANIAMTLGFVALAGHLVRRDRWQWIYLAGPFLALVACLLSASRGPVLAAVVILPVYLVFLARKSLRQALVLPLLGIVVFGVAGGLLVLFAPHQIERILNIASVVAEALTSGTTADESTNIRLGLYQVGWRAFQDAPIFGHGWDNIIPPTHPYMSAWLFDRAENFDYLHNEFLDFAVGAGVLGILAYALILVAPVAGVLMGPRDADFPARLFVALGLTLGFVVYGLTSRLMGHALQLTLFAFITALLLGYGTPHASTDKGRAS